jgi:alanine-synthesizing transaminase
MFFSSRLGHTTERNRLAFALDARRAAGLPIADLTLSNPTRAGFVYPAGLLRPLAQARALCYEPQPFGLPSARQAVSAEFARRGVEVEPDHIVLTASTSEAYSLLFKLLCDPGDVVLAPRPSYPLVEYLTELDAVSLEHYGLEFHGQWTIDIDGLQEKLSSHRDRRIRAIIMISPNNPTGSVVKAGELRALATLAQQHGLALISDEVFADYPNVGTACPSVLETPEVLSFALGGLSKSVGLPQLKLGWIGAGGPATLVADAMERLETICDAYLSVSTPVQVGVHELLKTGAQVRSQIQERVRNNFAALVKIAAAFPSCSVLPLEAGWYAVIQVPTIRPEEELVLELLDRTGVLVHPGYFFDFEREAFLVISLLPEAASFSSALQTLFHEIGQIR